MASVTHTEFGANTEGVEVVKAFQDNVRGKTILVTGANLNGLGFSAISALATGSPALLILAGRNVSRVQECIDAITKDHPSVQCRILQIDLSSQKSVRAAAEQVLSWQDVPTIDIVINSAGIMGIQSRTLNDDGIEMHFGTNHIGHWLLSSLIMPKIIKAAEKNPKGQTRIINVSSASPYFSGPRFSDINFETKNKDLPEVEQPNVGIMEAWGYKDCMEKPYIPLDGYNRSKVANVLCGIGATQRLFEKHGILSLAVHPGVIPTDLGRNFPQETLDAVKAMSGTFFEYKSQAAGSSTALVAALDPKLAIGVGQTQGDNENWGCFLEDCQISNRCQKLSVSSDSADKLWKISEKLVGQEFAW